MFRMLRLLFFAILAFVACKLAANTIKKRSMGKNSKDADEAGALDILMVKDPVCGMLVDAHNSVSARDGTGVIYFCGDECRDAYLAGQRKLHKNGN
ncbi:hypothetical protein FACS1894206_07110 [Deltaproteobacteria bacterium]|nr:hypothetical protein FACS1894206_07110 [Deltaproteobacteria bacterium]